MREQAPVLEILIVPDGDGARLYVGSWCPPAVRSRFDAQLSAVIRTKPDAGELEQFMFAADAPYRFQARAGKLEIVARGRSAIVLGEWMGELLSS